jgi:serine/threonine protein kinase
LDCSADQVTDIKPNNVLVNRKPDDGPGQEDSENRFAEIQVADFGSCVPADSIHAKKGDLIGTSIFRSPEASLKMQWGTPTDIWSFGAMVGYNEHGRIPAYKATAAKLVFRRLSHLHPEGVFGK